MSLFFLKSGHKVIWKDFGEDYRLSSIKREYKGSMNILKAFGGETFSS